MMFGIRHLKYFSVVVIFFALCGCILVSDGAEYGANGSDGGGADARLPGKILSFETAEGTWMGVDVSPDGETLVFNLLGDLYLLPIAGGEAVPLTSGRPWDVSPRFSPDGAHVYFISDRQGYKNVWRLALADRSLKQVTDSSSYILSGLNWTSDRSHLLAGSGVQRSPVMLHRINPQNGSMIQVYPPVNSDGANSGTPYVSRPFKLFSGVGSMSEKIYFSILPNRFANMPYPGAKISVFDPATHDAVSLTPDGRPYDEFMPLLSNGGKQLAYFRQYSDRRTELRVRNVETGEDKALTVLKDHDEALYTSDDDFRPSYAFTPDDRYVIFWHAGKLHRVQLADGHADIIPFRANISLEVAERVTPSVKQLSDVTEVTTIRWPSFSADGETMVFSAVGYVWVMDAPTQKIRRLTKLDEFEFMPALSPDGKSVAYISFAWSEGSDGSGRLMAADIDGANIREVLADPEARYLLPQWSPDGSKIAVAKEPKTRGGKSPAYGWTTLRDSQFRQVLSPADEGGFGGLLLNGRYVSFNQAGDKLLVSYSRSRTETVLTATDLNGANTEILAIGEEFFLGIAPSPDLKNLVLSRGDNSLWLVPLMERDGQPVVVSSSVPEARRISRNGGYSINWHSPNQLSFGFGKNVYRYDLGAGERTSLRVSVPVVRPKAAGPVAFTGARLITLSGERGAGRIIENGTIIVDGMRIAEIGSTSEVRIPENMLTIDLAGTTIIPGLLDTHYHSRSDASSFAFPASAIEDKSAIAYGVTSAWEPVGTLDDGMAAIADLQANGRIAGPRWSYSTAGGGHLRNWLTSYNAIFATVEQRKALGVDTLKEYNLPTRQRRQWLALAARAQGVGIVSHMDHIDSFLTRIVDGYTGGDHYPIPAAPLNKDVQELLTQSRFIWTPDFLSASSVIGFEGREGAKPWRAQTYSWREIAEKRPQELVKYEKLTGQTIEISDPGIPYEDHRAFRLGKAIADVASRGARIGVSAHEWPASRVHEQMWHLWKGGMPAGEVLRATSMTNAEKIGWQEEVGSLEVGKIADFLILDENPLDDILNTLSLEYTVQGGVIYDSDTAEQIDPQTIRITVH